MDRLNLVSGLHREMGFSPEEIRQGLEQRSPECQLDIMELEAWIEPSSRLPDWINRLAAVWVIEHWMSERDTCDAEGLLRVDEKYTRLLKDFSMGDIISMRNSVAAADTS